VFSYGGSATTNNSSSDNTTINISDSTITTTKDNSGGIMTTGGGIMNATNLKITTAGTSSAAIRSDRGGGTVTVNKGSNITSVSGGGTYDYGTQVTIKCSYPSNSSPAAFPSNPSIGKTHDRTTITYSGFKWTNPSNQTVSTSTSYTFKVTSNVTYTASVNKSVTTEKYQYSRPDEIKVEMLVVGTNDTTYHYGKLKDLYNNSNTVDLTMDNTNVFRFNNDNDVIAFWSQPVNTIKFRYYSQDINKWTTREWKNGHIINYNSYPGKESYSYFKLTNSNNGKPYPYGQNLNDFGGATVNQGANGQGKYPANTLFIVNGYQSVNKRTYNIRIYYKSTNVKLYDQGGFEEIWRGVYQLGSFTGAYWKKIN
jgi:hypothetical protein